MLDRRLLVLALVACSGKASEPTAEPVKHVPADAAVDGITEIGGNDPKRFTDPDPEHPTAPMRPAHNRPSRPIDVMLKSTPAGARAAVDGVPIGYTPTYWYGESDGREHEFTFSLRGYGSGRYRFVPIQSGTVHARLEPVSDEGLIDGGVDPVTVPNAPPQFTPANPGPSGPLDSPRPPDTVVTPVDAATGSGSASSGSKVGPQP